MHDGYADRLKKMRADAVPCGSAFVIRSGRWMALLNDALSPVISFQRTVESHADVGYSGKRGEAIFDLAIESREPIGFVTGTGGIDLHHVPICGRNTEILVFQVVERFGHQNRAGKQ